MTEHFQETRLPARKDVSGDSIHFSLAQNVIQKEITLPNRRPVLCVSVQRVNIVKVIRTFNNTLKFVFSFAPPPRVHSTFIMINNYDYFIGKEKEAIPSSWGKFSLCGMRGWKCPPSKPCTVFPSHDDREPTGMYLSSFRASWLVPVDLIYST